MDEELMNTPDEKEEDDEDVVEVRHTEVELNAVGFDEEIFTKVETLMNQLRKNQKIQELSEQNGLQVKNSVRLTDDSINNIAVAIVSLLLAKKSNDPRYKKLVRTGIKKRSLKTEIINDYKNQANQMIGRYRASRL